MFFKTILRSMQRRKKEIRFVSVITFIIILFMSALSLFQNCMDKYLREMNYKNYGEWVLSSVAFDLEHPYFERIGHCYTGSMLLEADGSSQGEYLGYVDDEFQEFAHLTFYEGRMPEADNEIVMTLTALSRYQYSFDLNQTIKVYVWQGEELVEKDFVLVGTIKDYANGWRRNGEYPLPSCLVTEEALLKLCEVSHTTKFYQLDRAYENINMQEFIMPFMTKASEEYSKVLAELEEQMEREEWLYLLQEEEAVKMEKYTIQYNDYVYNASVWGSKDMLQTMQYILILMMVFVVSYLMMSYVSKRRKWYYQMRSTGAAREQIWTMIAVEGCYGILPWAVIGMVLPYIAGYFICGEIAKNKGIADFYVADQNQLVLQSSSIVLVLVVSIICACIQCSDKRLSVNTKELNAKQMERLRKSKEDENLAEAFWKRQSRVRPYQKMMTLALTSVVCGVIILCVHIVYGEYHYFQWSWKGEADFEIYNSVDMEIPITIEVKQGSGETIQEERTESAFGSYSMHDGISQELEEQLLLIDGVKSYTKTLRDDFHDLDWNGREESEIYQKEYSWIEKQFPPEETMVDGVERFVNKHTITTFYFFNKYEEAIEKFSKLVDVKGLDEERFAKGEQVVVVLNEQEEYIFTGFGEPNVEIRKETTLHTGDVATIQNAMAEDVCDVEVITVSLSSQDWMKTLGYQYTEAYLVIGSFGLADRISEAEGKAWEYNDYQVFFEPNSSFTSTTKRLASLIEEYDHWYGFSWEQKQIEREIMIRNASIYGTFLLLVVAVYLIIQLNLNQMKQYDRTQKYQIFKRLGMSDEYFLKNLLREGIRDSVWLFAGIPIGYVLYFGYAWMSFKAEFGAGKLTFHSTYLATTTDSVFWWCMQQIRDKTSIWVVSLVTIVLFGVTLFTVYRSSKQAMQKEGKRS